MGSSIHGLLGAVPRLAGADVVWTADGRAWLIQYCALRPGGRGGPCQYGDEHGGDGKVHEGQPHDALSLAVK